MGQGGGGGGRGVYEEGGRVRQIASCLFTCIKAGLTHGRLPVKYEQSVNYECKEKLHGNFLQKSFPYLCKTGCRAL